MDATSNPVPTLVADGRQISGGATGPASQVVAGAALDTFFQWPEQSLPSTTKSFRLVCSFYNQQAGLIQFDFGVRLIG